MALMVWPIHVFSDDYSVEESWRLLRWCMERGADEFSLHIRHTPPDGPTASRWIEDRLTVHASGVADRAVMTIAQGQSWYQEIPVYRLTDASLDLLADLMPEGPFVCRYSESAWVEDPILYRSGEFFMGVVSHEAEGALELNPSDRDAFVAAGFPSGPEGRWVGPPPPRS